MEPVPITDPTLTKTITEPVPDMDHSFNNKRASENKSLISFLHE
jgi:hypothetical protein